MKALRYNDQKPKLGYFLRSFPRALEAIARIKEFGAAKYNDGNWRLGGKPDDEYLDSCTRHLTQFLDGEAFDQDSGCHHLGHAIWNLCAWLELNTEGPLTAENFEERCKYWEEAKEAKREAKREAVITHDISVDEGNEGIGLRFVIKDMEKLESVKQLFEEYFHAPFTSVRTSANSRRR